MCIIFKGDLLDPWPLRRNCVWHTIFIYVCVYIFIKYDSGMFMVGWDFLSAFKQIIEVFCPIA